MKNVFITGAAGFIGFHLAKALAALGYRVIGYDNYNDYYDPELKYQRTEILKKSGVQIVRGDICDFQTLQKAVQQHSTTHLIHLAAQAGVRYSLTNPQAYVKANLEGFVNILEVSKNMSDMKLIYASSSSVYGRNQKTPYSPEDRTDYPASLYGATKKSNELMAEVYHHLYALPVIGLRFFTVYGPWGRPDMAYYSFTKAILSGEPIDVYNHGKMQRDFTYIDDIVNGIIEAMKIDGKAEIFNLGNRTPVALSDFIATIEKHTGMKATIRYLPMQAGDVLSTHADITESTKRLNFVPKTSLDEGIAKFVAWYKEHENGIAREIV